MYYKSIENENGNKQLGKDVLMTQEDHNFLTGLLKEYKPKKLLEVGVYAGGTTLAMLDCLENLGTNQTKVYSVDLATTLDTNKACGYLILEEKQRSKEKFKNHFLYTGVTVAEIIETLIEDGEKFDFVIIDTVHYLPGEILDFLAVFPFLANNAIVVLHDVMLNQVGAQRCEATKVVFDVVTGNKIWNWKNGRRANIAAVQINQDTRKYITDLISALSISWHQNPGTEIIAGYRNIIKKYYTSEQCELFDMIISLDNEWWNRYEEEFEKFVSKTLKHMLLGSEKELYIYGTGKLGEWYLEQFRRRGLDKKICGFVVSDDWDSEARQIDGLPIMRFSELDLDDENLFIILASDNRELYEKLNSGAQFYYFSPTERSYVHLYENPEMKYQ